MIMEGTEVPIFGDGSLERDYTYIDDIVDGILQALDTPAKFEVFNLGNSHPIRIDEMVETLGRALEKPVRRRFVPTPAGEMLLTHADLTKSHRALGYSPKVSFQQGTQQFAEWLKSRASSPHGIHLLSNHPAAH
jgi:UDP-glucuronate 4-epimerase